LSEVNPDFPVELGLIANLDREIMALNAKHAAAMLDSRHVPAGNRSGPIGQWTDLALIDHEITKQKRHLPIRQLVNRAGGALKALKPCFMMEPLSVAQYLEPGLLQFDVVIMDEASQLKPEDALGAIARGAQLVVVGDPKQLPPTSFFERTMDDGDIPDDELTAAEDAESILDVASSVYQPVRRLRWHYRSRHHSLIEFSNHEFYKNLIIFPSAYADHPELGVKLVKVQDGRFVNRRNVAEAQKVVDAAIEHMRLHSHESLGIVALNFEQRELIDDLLDNAIVSDPQARQLRD
jgi:superfamily I DNA and/or RNA helicase